jgi:hypothetical protein
MMRLLIALFATTLPVFADTLVSGAVYFDSRQTLEKVVMLSSQHDNEEIAKLISNGQISKQTTANTDVVVLISGTAPESPSEFRFLDGSTTYWTLSKFVTHSIKSTSNPISTSTPEPTPIEEKYGDNGAVDEAGPRATPKHQHQQRSKGSAPFDDDNGQRIWHQVDGKWKWYPANKRHVEVKKALPPGQAPRAQPVKP